MEESSGVHLHAPVLVMTVCIRGKVKLRIPAIRGFVSKTLVSLGLEIGTKSIVDTNGPSHSLLSLNSGKHLGRVLESNWPFSQRVADGKKVDEPVRRK